MQVKRRIFAGATCDQIVYETNNGARAPGDKRPRMRFKDEYERAEHRRQISKRRHARTINENYGPTSLYSTLTMNSENECHDYEEARQLRDLYYRKLHRAFPEAKINIYMGQGKHTHRFHFHMLTDGIPEEFIRSKWTYGENIRIEHLREHNYYDGEDHGRDYTALANYLFDHWTPEQGKGKRYKQSMTVRPPKPEEATECLRRYSPARPPITPKGYKYIGCDYNLYGYMNFHYVIIPPKDDSRRRC